MKLGIKRLQQNGEYFVPQTTAEAVLVKDSNQILTLDKLLEKKIESIITPAGSGLNSFSQGKSIILTHSNTITPNQEAEPLNIQFDSHGHIINTSSTQPLILTINDIKYIDYTGKTEQRLDLGNDFRLDENNKLVLKFNKL